MPPVVPPWRMVVRPHDCHGCGRVGETDGWVIACPSCGLLALPETESAPVWGLEMYSSILSDPTYAMVGTLGRALDDVGYLAGRLLEDAFMVAVVVADDPAALRVWIAARRRARRVRRALRQLERDGVATPR